MRTYAYVLLLAVSACSVEKAGFRTTASEDNSSDEREIKSKSSNATSNAEEETNAEIALLQGQIDELKKLLEKEMKNRKADSAEFRKAIDEIRANLGLLNSNMTEVRAKLAESDRIRGELLGEFEALLGEHATWLQSLEERVTANESDIEGLADEIEHLSGLLADQGNLTDAKLAEIRAEIAAKQVEYDEKLVELENQDQITVNLINEVQDDAIRRALEAEHKFAQGIKDLAEANNDMIKKLVEGMDILASRIESLESRVDILEVAVDEIGNTLSDVQAKIEELEGESEETKSRVKALEQFKQVTKLCAAVTVGLEQSNRARIEAQRQNRSLFGPTKSANLGYGSLYARKNRFKYAEKLFDQYHYNLTQQSILESQMALVQQVCAAMVAFPDRPSAYDYATIGFTPSPTDPSQGVKWSIPTDVELRQTFRFLPRELQTPENLDSLSKMLADYNNIYTTGAQLSPTEWDRHFNALVMVAVHGLKLVSASSEFLADHLTSQARHVQQLPNDARNRICRFGNGSADRDDADGLSYLDEETDVINGEEVNFHLPQQYFYRKVNDDIYIARSGYSMGMGPSATKVLNILNAQDGLVGITDGATLVDTADSVNTYNNYPTVLERNVKTHLTSNWRNARKICRDKHFSRDGFRRFKLPVMAQIPFSKYGGCWHDRIGETRRVCSRLLFNPEGDTNSSDPLVKRFVPRTHSNKAAHKNQKFVVNKLTSTNYPEGTFQSTADLNRIYVVELFYETEVEKFAGKSEELCRNAARFPKEDLTVSYNVWRGLKNKYQLHNTELLRSVDDANASSQLMIRACLRGHHAPYSQKIYVDGEQSNQKLVFQPDLYLPIVGDDNGNLRLAMTQSRCGDICQALDLDKDGMPDNMKGKVSFYGYDDNPGEPITYNRDLSTGIPWIYNIRAMVNKDKCSCETNTASAAN